MIRLFLGLPLPESCRERLAAIAHGLPGARFIAPETYHLTLRFIGEVDERRADDIAEAMDRLAHPAVAVRIAGLGLSGQGHRAATLWAEAEPTPQLAALQEKVERLCRAAGCAAETRRFHPHVTLARLKGAPPDRVQAYLSAHGLVACPPFSADAVVLYSSILTPRGSLYTEEMRFPLAAGALPSGRTAGETP